jgi:hypothetical protein
LTDNLKTLFSTSFFNFEPASSGAHVSSWIWLYFVVTAAFTALCLFGWYYSSQTMAQAAERTSINGEIHEDEKTQDSDSRIDSAHKTGKEDAEKPSPCPISRPPSDRLPIDQNSDNSTSSAAATTNPINYSSSDNTLTKPSSGNSDTSAPAPARAHWDASDVWGTQSYGESKKACAMCAQHIE